LLAEDLLDALDRVAVVVKKRTDAAQKIDILRPVIAPPAAALQRADLAEFALPESEDVLRHIQLGCDLADGPESIWRFLYRQTKPLLTFLNPISEADMLRQGPCSRAFAHSAAAALPLKALLMRSLSTWLGRNTRTRRGLIGTSSPVLGLRPIRPPFCRTEKEPNEESFTVSPFDRLFEISFSTDSTSSADSLRESPTS